jgi:hypothetical protein
MEYEKKLLPEFALLRIKCSLNYDYFIINEKCTFKVQIHLLFEGTFKSDGSLEVIFCQVFQFTVK